MEKNNLIENIRDFFIEKYEGVEESNSFLSFEPIGCMIDPSDFEGENDEISDIKATEQLSILGDRLPDIDDIFLANTSSLSNMYEFLINDATFHATDDMDDITPYLARFSEVKAEALRSLEVANKASIETPEGNYLPVIASPENWYDPKGSFWVRKEFSTKEKKDSTARKAPKGSKVPLTFAWKTKFVTNPEVLKQQVNAKSVIKTKAKLKPQTFLHTKMPIMILKKSPVKKTKKKSIKKFSKVVPGHSLTKAIVKSRQKSSKLRLNQLKKRRVKSNLNISPTIWKDLKVLKHLNVAERVNLTGHIAKVDTTPVVPVSSNHFTMSFDYCIVKLNRKWYDTSIFNYSKMWYSLTQDEGFYSSGAKDNSNEGVLKCVPTAMILIKNLEIDAAWTDEDKINAKNSIGIGNFNVNESQFHNNKLITPGMQIIGWMCEVVPRLPLISDPNF